MTTLIAVPHSVMNLLQPIIGWFGLIADVEWLIHDFDNLHTSKFQDIYELCRHRQLNWKEDILKYGKAKEGKTVTHLNEAKEGNQK